MIHIKKSSDNQYFFIIKATNGKTLATSEMYTRKRNCVKGAEALQYTAYQTAHRLVITDKTV